MTIPSPHIEATSKDLIAKTVLMPGDPKRAEMIANKYLTDAVLFNAVRGMSGFTGKYKGKQVSVMGSGMGIPSIGIYSYELFKFYDVDNIIRVGSCGSYDGNYSLYDVVLADDCYSESTYAMVQNSSTDKYLKATANLNQKIVASAKKLSINMKQARVHSTDVFYTRDNEYYKKIYSQHKCQVVEMEAFGLFANAIELNKNAACLLTVSDSFVTHGSTTAEERQNSFTQMIEIALNSLD